MVLSIEPLQFLEVIVGSLQVFALLDDKRASVPLEVRTYGCDIGTKVRPVCDDASGLIVLVSNERPYSCGVDTTPKPVVDFCGWRPQRHPKKELTVTKTRMNVNGIFVIQQLVV